MTVSAVEFYVQGLLDGQDILGADDLGNIQALVIPPAVVQIAPNPVASVWSLNFEENRHTIPRGQGYKRTIYSITVFLQLATANEDFNNDFDLVIQTVMRILRSTPIPVELTDSQTGETSTLELIGDRIRVQHPTPVASADQRLLLHNATLITEAIEEIGA
jgi:hypothetical protein